MTSRITLTLLSLVVAVQAEAAQVRAVAPTTAAPLVLRPGLVITTSARVARRTYQLPANPSVDSAVIVIRGNDITVDFDGAVLRGTPVDADPDAAAGVAVRIDGGHNVRIFNNQVKNNNTSNFGATATSLFPSNGL